MFYYYHPQPLPSVCPAPTFWLSPMESFLMLSTRLCRLIVPVLVLVSLALTQAPTLSAQQDKTAANGFLAITASPAVPAPILPSVIDPMDPDNRIALFLEDKYWQAHNRHLATPGQLGSNGCAAALWEYAIRPALVKHTYLKDIPQHLQVTHAILAYYKKHHLGQVIEISRQQLDASKIPPGSTLIGIKSGGDHHMLGAIELEGRWRHLPAVGPDSEPSEIPEVRDGLSEAFVGNTGLAQWIKEVGYAHVRVQEFSANHDVARLNQHHGALDGNRAGNPYVRFIILTWRQQPIDVRKDA